MDDSHLVNAMKLLERVNRAEYEMILDHPPSFQGELAQMYADWEYQRLLNDGPDPYLYANEQWMMLRYEAFRRKLPGYEDEPDPETDCNE
jgi:hypothetical protein